MNRTPKWSFLPIVLCSFATVVPGIVAAGEAAPGAPALDSCFECHGREATRGQAPLLRGQHEGYLRVQLQRLRDRHRDVFPMSRLAGGFSDTQIAAIAEALAGHRWLDRCESANPALVERGAVVADRMLCYDCHGADLHGGDVIPRLAGQDRQYLARQLRNFITGARYHPPAAGGLRMGTLDPDEVEALAALFNRADCPPQQRSASDVGAPGP